MELTGKLESDPVFLGMTRPPMLMGVTYLWAMMEIGAGCIYFINSSDFKVFLYAGILHLVGLLVCARDARAVDVWLVGAKTNFKCFNKSFHGNISSYDLY